jgi:hypothetical protein
MRRTVALFFAAYLGACAAAASDIPIKIRGACLGNSDPASLRVRRATLSDPWRFLRLNWWMRDDADRAVAAMVGKPFTPAALNQVQTVVERDRFLPDDTPGIGTINYLNAALENCESQQLDVVFRVFSASISPVFSSVFEFHQKERSAPDEASRVPSAWSFRAVPVAGYDRSDGFFAGGRLTGRWEAARVPFGELDVEGYGSSSARQVSASLSGGYDSATGWLAHSEWRLVAENSSFPTDVSPLSRSRVAMQFSGTSRPRTNGLLLRFGAVAEGGNLQSRFGPNDLAAKTLASTGYTSAKLYIGATAHPARQAFAVNYGLGFGSTGNGFHGDWRKHIGDVAHSIWWPTGDHRQLELDHRLTVGGIQTLRVVPAVERFFGGNRQEFFVPGESWQIVSSPVIRSIPANGLYQTAAGAGGEQFISYSSTTALTVWSKPLVPRELTDDAGFKKELDSALTSATSILQVAFASQDRKFRDTLALLPETSTKLGELKAAVTGLGAAAPSTEQTACAGAILPAARLIQHAMADKPQEAFGSVKELLPSGLGDLGLTVSACGELNATLKNPAIASALDRLAQLAHTIQADFMAIDQDAASAKAAAEMSFARRTLNTLLQEVNIASISPAFVFDAARIGPGGRTRYGVGGGIRISLVSSVNITAGYAWNPDRRPHEAPGAFFFSFNTRNLFP